MTTAAPEAKRLLDQLQNEINRVLEQTGRLFAAAKINGPVPPVAQAARLKQVLPDCIDKFHSALDELEDELQTAKIVLRRDLALLRAKDDPVQPSGDANETESATEARPDVTMSEADKPTEDTTKDIEMTDDQANETEAELAIASAPKPDEAIPSMTTADKPAEQRQDNARDQSNENHPLRLDTTNQPDQPPDENQADTGTASNNADLESLFGGSADASATNEANNDVFDMAAPPDNDAGDFDFGAFTNELTNEGQGGNVADADDIAALIPGLQDYAKSGDGGGGSGDPEFDAIFGDNSNTDVQENDGQGQADDIFGDLLADFPSGEYNNEGQDQEFDFGFS